MRFDSVLLAVRDMDRARQFYREVLGLETAADFGANVVLEGGVSLQTLDTWQSFVKRDASEIVLQNNAGELYFEEPDIDGFYARLCARTDVQFVHSLLMHDWGQRAVRFYDPDGHVIEVGESLRAVVRRFADEGMTLPEIARRMDVPEDYVRGLL